jgi:hypothetical protein
VGTLFGGGGSDRVNCLQSGEVGSVLVADLFRLVNRAFRLVDASCIGRGKQWRG